MNPSIELIRLLAVILITFTHTRNDLESGSLYFIVEKLPLYGTAILSVISGYLYYTVSRKKAGLFKRKIKSLAIPFLIANGSVLLAVLMAYYFFGYNPLNRLGYDFTLITEGLFALNSPPINPPTYFIRDIFVIFAILALFTQKEFKALLVIIPLLLFGTLVLRMDVAFLFLIGCLYGRFQTAIKKNTLIVISVVITIVIAIWFSEFLKFPIAFLLFILALDLKFKVYNTSRYSYLLHLYHSPIIVISYPFLSTLTADPFLQIVLQILISFIGVYGMYLITKRFEFLKVLSGGR